MEESTLQQGTVIRESLEQNSNQLLHTISELSASNVRYLEDIRQLQTTLERSNRQLSGLQYKLVENTNAKELYRNSLSTFVANASNMYHANTVTECISTMRDSLTRQFKLSEADVLFRTLGGVYEGSMKISEFLNHVELATTFLNLSDYIDSCQKLNNLTLTQCNSEQMYFLGCTRNYAYSAIVIHETQPVFAIVFERETPLELSELQLLDTLLRAYAIVISFKRTLMQSTILSSAFASKYKHAVEKSLTDTLTRVYNREALEENVKQTYSNTRYLIIFYDLDKFKYVNDTFGHQAGDQVLSWFGGLVKEFTSELGGDAYRYGGDEFISIFTGEEELMHLVENNLENFMRKVRQKEFIFTKVVKNQASNEDNHEEEELIHKHRITTSIGLFYNKDGLPFDEAKKLADNGLYESKESGRNTITIVNGVQ